MEPLKYGKLIEQTNNKFIMQLTTLLWVSILLKILNRPRFLFLKSIPKFSIFKGFKFFKKFYSYL